VLWRSGLRISEALAPELRDLDLEASTIRVRRGKGDRSRTVGVDEQTAALLYRWLDRRRRLSPGARAPNVIRDALGHTTLAVTDRYLRDVAPIHVIETMRARRREGA